MKAKTGFRQMAEAQVVKKLSPKLSLRGVFKIEHIRKGKKIGEYEAVNDITNEGLNAILDTMFNAASQTDPWFCGLIDGSGAQTLANTDVMNSHGGWAELTAYDETPRQSWAPGAASSQQVTNAAQMVFTMNATDTVHGIFITTSATKGGTSGVLWSTAAFASEISVVATDELRVTYTVTAARG